MPGTIINLQNAPEAPAPTGLQGVLNTVSNPNAFRDMAGLAGTQANAAAALNTTANLATQFGTQAVELKKAEMAASVAKQKMAAIEKAHNSKAIGDDERTKQTAKVLDELTESSSKPLSTGDVSGIIRDASQNKTKVDFATALGESLGVDARDISLAGAKGGAPPSGAPFGGVFPSGPLTLNISVPYPFDWAPGIGDANELGELFRKDYNSRVERSIFTGPTAVLGSPLIMGRAAYVEEEAKNRTLAILPLIAVQLDSESGRRDIWDTVYKVAYTSAVDATKLIRPTIYRTDEPGIQPQNILETPIHLLYIAKRAGIFMAWLDAAIVKAIANEADRMETLKLIWSGGALAVDIATDFIPIPLLGTGLGLIFDEGERALDRQLDSYKQGLELFKQSYERITDLLFRSVLLENTPPETTLLHPEIPLYFSAFRAYTLTGWDEEIKFLGIRLS
jgi:hypothetical protein